MRKLLCAIFVGLAVLATAQVKVSRTTFQYTSPAGFTQTRSEPIQFSKGETATITLRVLQAQKQSLKQVADRYIQIQRKSHDLIVLSDKATTVNGQPGRTVYWTYIDGVISVRERLVLVSKGKYVAIIVSGSVRDHEEIDDQFMKSLKSFKFK